MDNIQNSILTYWNNIWSYYTTQQRMKLLMEFDEECASFLLNSQFSKSSYDVHGSYESVITMTSGENRIKLVYVGVEYSIDDTDCPFDLRNGKGAKILKFIKNGVDLFKISNQSFFHDNPAFLTFLRSSGIDLKNIRKIRQHNYIAIETTDDKFYYVMNQQERSDYALNECSYMYQQLMVNSQDEMENMHDTEVKVSWVQSLTGLKKSEIVSDNTTTIPSWQAAKLILEHCSEVRHFDYILKHQGWNGIINKNKFPEIIVDDYHIYQII